MRSLVDFVHPVLIAQCLQDEEDVEAERAQRVRFLLRAITPRTERMMSDAPPSE